MSLVYILYLHVETNDTLIGLIDVAIWPSRTSFSASPFLLLLLLRDLRLQEGNLARLGARAPLALVQRFPAREITHHGTLVIVYKGQHSV